MMSFDNIFGSWNSFWTPSYPSLPINASCRTAPMARFGTPWIRPGPWAELERPRPFCDLAAQEIASEMAVLQEDWPQEVGDTWDDMRFSF